MDCPNCNSVMDEYLDGFSCEDCGYCVCKKCGWQGDFDLLIKDAHSFEVEHFVAEFYCPADDCDAVLYDAEYF